MISVLYIALANAVSAFTVSIVSLICTSRSEKKIEEYDEQWQKRIDKERDAVNQAKFQAAKLAAGIKTQQAIGSATQQQNTPNTSKPKPRAKVKSKPVVVEPPREAVPQLPIERFYDDPRIE